MVERQIVDVGSLRKRKASTTWNASNLTVTSLQSVSRGCLNDISNKDGRRLLGKRPCTMWRCFSDVDQLQLLELCELTIVT